MPRQSDSKQVSVRITLRQKAELEREAAQRGVSRSGYIRSVLADRDEPARLQEEIETLRDRLDAREDRIDELEQQLAERSRVEEKIENLPDQLRDEMSYQERRQRKLDQASLSKRLKWKVTGVPVESDEPD